MTGPPVSALLSEKGPCLGCKFAERCATENLACERFLMFTEGAGLPRWQTAPMAPTRAMWLAVFEAAK